MTQSDAPHQAIPMAPPRPPRAAPTAEHVADRSSGYRLAVGCMLALGMAQWLDAQTWLPLGASREAVHFVAQGVVTFCGLALGFLPALRRRASR